MTEVLDRVERLALNEALAEVFRVVNEVNRYLEHTAPWQRARQGDPDRVATVLYTAAEALRLASSPAPAGHARAHGRAVAPAGMAAACCAA